MSDQQNTVIYDAASVRRMMEDCDVQTFFDLLRYRSGVICMLLWREKDRLNAFLGRALGQEDEAEIAEINPLPLGPKAALPGLLYELDHAERVILDLSELIDRLEGIG